MLANPTTVRTMFASLPADVDFVNAFYNHVQGCWYITVWHPSFPPVPDGTVRNPEPFDCDGPATATVEAATSWRDRPPLF